MLLTASGPPGSGKSTTVAMLAEASDLEHISGGDIFRELVAGCDVTAIEFNRLAEKDDQIDCDLDRRLRDAALDRDDVLLESRLAGWPAGDTVDLYFWLDVPVDVRAKRIVDREGKLVGVAREETTTREMNEAKRYMGYYNVDYSDLSIYDIPLNTARWGGHEVSEIVTSVVEAYDPEADEGKYPVDGVRYDF